jgi:hypothetical protein
MAAKIDYFKDCIVKKPLLLKLFVRQRDAQYLKDRNKDPLHRITVYPGLYRDDLAEEIMKNFCKDYNLKDDDDLNFLITTTESEIKRLERERDAKYQFKKSNKSKKSVKKSKKSKKSVKKSKKSKKSVKKSKKSV